MAAPASTLNPSHRPIPLPRSSSRRAVSEELATYQFQVVAANLADVVASIGGLIFDRAMAGWEVSVVVDGATPVDDRAIRILGGRVATRLSDPNHAGALARPHLLAVATDVMVRSDAMRRHVLEIGSHRETDVLLWGRHRPTNLGCTFLPTRHRPSAAAQVFKSQAVLAGGAQAIERADEGFYSMT